MRPFGSQTLGLSKLLPPMLMTTLGIMKAMGKELGLPCKKGCKLEYSQLKIVTLLRGDGTLATLTECWVPISGFLVWFQLLSVLMLHLFDSCFYSSLASFKMSTIASNCPLLHFQDLSLKLWHELFCHYIFSTKILAQSLSLVTW